MDMDTSSVANSQSRTSIKPPLRKVEKKPTPFIETKFTMAQLCELLSVAKTSVYNLEKEGFIKSEMEPYGSSERKIYTWIEFAKIAERFRNRIPKPLLNKIKVFANLKGGVGKSTLATQMAMMGSSWGMKVLAIDLDPQANMTMGLASLSLAREDHPTIRDILIEKEPIGKVVKELTPLLHLIPANLSLSSLERKLQSENNRDRKLKNFLNEIKNGYDLIIIDTSPAASLVNVNAFVAADEICVVSATEYLSTSGLTSFFELLEDLQNDFGIEPSVRIIPNQFDVRNGMDQESLGLLRRDWSEFLVTSVIRKNIDIREAHKLRQSLWIYKKSSTASEDLELLAKELFNESVN